MKWFDETGYDEKTGEGTILFLEEERKWVGPGDEILLNCGGVWIPVVVAEKENKEGEIAVYAARDGESVEESALIRPQLLARTKRLPPGFLIHPEYQRQQYHLQHYSEQLLAQEQTNGNGHPPPFPHTSDYQRLFLVRVVMLLHGEFAGRDVPHRPLKHRAVNDLLPALPMEVLALHEYSEESTRDGMWVKYLERNIGDLRHIKGQLVKFKGFGQLADVVPAKTIRWVGSEEAYEAILDLFRDYRALIPTFKSYNNNHKEAVQPTIEIEMTDADLGKKFDVLVQRIAEKEAKEEEYRKQSEARDEQHRKDMAELNKKVDRLTATGAEANPPLPPDQSKEFKADLKAVLTVALDEPYDVIFTTEVIAKSVAVKWGSKTDNLGFLQIDKKKNIRTEFSAFVKAALMEMWYAKEIQRVRAENPSPEPGDKKVNDWFWSVLKNPVHSV